MTIRRRGFVKAGLVAGLAALSQAATARRKARRKGPALDFVLVHGTWLGAWIWKDVIPLIYQAGHRAHAVTLTGTGERAHLISPDVGLETHIADIMALIESHDMRRVVLVGHSFSGIAITAVADRLRERIHRLIYFDAIVPAGNRIAAIPADPATGALPESFRKRIPGFADGYKMDFFADYPIQMLANDDEPETQALARRNIRPHPMRGWTDAVDLKNGGWQGLPRTLIICGRQQYRPSSDAMLGPARGDPGFRLVTLPISRLGMVSKPQLVAQALLAEGIRTGDG